MMVNSAAWHVEVNNDLKEFLTRLNAFDADVAKILKRDMKRGANLVTKDARSRVRSAGTPLSNWAKSWVEQDRSNGRDLAWNTGRAAAGIKTVPFTNSRARAVVKFGFAVVQRDAAGSIYETAGGSDKPYKGTRGGGSKKMRANINKSSGSGPYPRTLFPAYYAQMPQVQRDIEAAIKAAQKAVGK